MNIMNIIRNKKREFETERTMKKANKLKALKQERVRVEGAAKIDRLYDSEQSKIKAAKKERFERSITGKLVKGFKSYQSKRPPKNKKLPKSKNLDNKINDAFSLGTGKKKKYFYE